MTMLHHVIFDWGGTLMPDDPARTEPMYLWPDVRVYQDVRPTLLRLQYRYTLGIASNAAQSDEGMIRLALARVGIADFFPGIFCYRSLGVRKSDPRFWPLVLQTLSAQADEVGMVGDSLEEDVLPAACQGLRAWWLNRASAERRAGPGYGTIHALDELLRDNE